MKEYWCHTLDRRCIFTTYQLHFFFFCCTIFCMVLHLNTSFGLLLSPELWRLSSSVPGWPLMHGSLAIHKLSIRRRQWVFKKSLKKKQVGAVSVFTLTFYIQSFSGQFKATTQKAEHFHQYVWAVWLFITWCHFTFTFTFSHLADAFVQSDVQGREQSS